MHGSVPECVHVEVPARIRQRMRACDVLGELLRPWKRPSVHACVVNLRACVLACFSAFVRQAEKGGL